MSKKGYRVCWRVKEWELLILKSEGLDRGLKKKGYLNL